MRLRVKSLLFGNNMLNKATIATYPENVFYYMSLLGWKYFGELILIAMVFKFVKAVERYDSMALTVSKT